MNILSTMGDKGLCWGDETLLYLSLSSGYMHTYTYKFTYRYKFNGVTFLKFVYFIVYILYLNS